MKNILFALIPIAAMLLPGSAATAAQPRWEILSGQWTIGPERIVPVAAAEPCVLADRSMPWDCEWKALNVDFTLSGTQTGAFGILLHAENKDDYHLLRITPGSDYTALQMLRWQYGNFRLWQEAHFAPLLPDTEYDLSIVRAPVIDKEDWRPWKIVIRDKASGKILHKESVENHMPAFGLGITGLYATTDSVAFSGYRLDRPAPENMAGELRLPMVFSDGMVLQRERSNPVWGAAAAGAPVKLTIGGKTYKTRADGSGQWEIRLDALGAATGLDMRIVSGRDEITLRDIAVGEVWLASGQSNMEMKVWESNVPMVTDPDIRLFTQFQWSSQEPLFTAGGRWQKSDTTVVPRWSAVAYAFAQELRKRLGVPVGIIGTYFGGTAIESWLPRQKLGEDSLTRPILERFEQSLYQLEHGLPVEERFPWCWDVAGQRHTPGDLYNGMVSPLAPYGIRGIIWYQGETSAPRARQYGRLFPMLVDSWRETWGDPEMKFYYVQLAGYDGRESGSEIESAWPHLRDVQRRLLDERDNTGLVVAFHLGDSLNIHPPYKREVGTRLANLALHDLYGFGDIVRSSPLLDKASFGDGKAVLAFRETAEGLASGDGKPLSGFLIAGADRHFYPAEAVVNPDGTSVTVRSEQVAVPVAVRYGWANYTREGNLVNSAGLPAATFRTDDWPLPTDDDL